MKCASIAVIVLVGLAACALGQNDTVTTAAPPAADPQPEKVCSAPGNICSTCDTVAVCVGNGDGGYETLKQPCQPDERCVAGQCVKGALCNYRPFQCSDEGYYPDPYECTLYHICLPDPSGGLSAVSFNCPVGSAYNSSSQDCSSTLLSAACLDRPVPECLTRLQIGPVSGDNTLYYVCIERDDTVAPELRRCPAGRHFDSATVTCTDAAVKDNKKKDKKKSKSKF